jgi:hypothetical protein
LPTTQKIWKKLLDYGPLYFDLDHEEFSVAHKECIVLYEFLASFISHKSILVYFTGKKGFHIECEPVALGINPSNTLQKTFRYIATDIKEKLSLSSLDFSVYDARRMWRVPGSIHQDTGLFKTLLNPYHSDGFIYASENSIKEYSSKPQSLQVDDQFFDYKANEWYRNYTYNLEENQKKKDNPIEYFNKYGSRAFKDLKQSEKVFDPNTLLQKCKAIQRLKNQAEQEKFLEHEARLFLCSILSYTEDSIKYLHDILSHCSDYNFEKSSAHINDWIKRRQLGIGGRPYTCDRANAVGVGCGDCNLEKKNKWQKIGEKFVETNEKSLPSPIRYAYKNKKEIKTES